MSNSLSAAVVHDQQPDNDAARVRAANELYDRYVQPFEDSHRGEFAGVFPDGRLAMGPTVLDVMQQVRAKYGRGATIFHVGNRVINR